MLPQAISLVASYDALVLVAIALTGVAVASAWTLAVRKRKASEPQ